MRKGFSFATTPELTFRDPLILSPGLSTCGFFFFPYPCSSACVYPAVSLLEVAFGAFSQASKSFGRFWARGVGPMFSYLHTHVLYSASELRGKDLGAMARGQTLTPLSRVGYGAKDCARRGCDTRMIFSDETTSCSHLCGLLSPAHANYRRSVASARGPATYCHRCLSLALTSGDKRH